MKTKFLEKKKKGAASIYIIVVTALLFSIITAGFINLVVSELENSAENNLSQSAYDSALAGIEDAKLARNEYYKCANQGYIEPAGSLSISNITSNDMSAKCGAINYLIQTTQEDGDKPLCNIVPLILGTQDDLNNPQPTYIKETTASGAFSGNIDTVQAYTCVTIDTTPPDYQNTLDESNSTVIVPLIPADSTGLATEATKNIEQITIEWWLQRNSMDNGDYSDETKRYGNIDATGKVKFGANTPLPPTISMQLFQTGSYNGASQFKLEDFSNTTSEDSTNRGTLWLVPSKENSDADKDPDGNKFSAKKLAQSNNHNTGDKDDGKNAAQRVKCDYVKDYICSVTIDLPRPQGNGERHSAAGTFMLMLSLVYNDPATEVRVTMKDSAGNTKNFYNVQASVDSTGKANDIFRRVEGRIEFHEVDFPIPQYALESLGGDDTDGLIKDFRVTKNCWTTDKDGKAQQCDGGDSQTEE